jgi:hypothetical protein
LPKAPNNSFCCAGSSRNSELIKHSPPHSNLTTSAQSHYHMMRAHQGYKHPLSLYPQESGLSRGNTYIHTYEGKHGRYSNKGIGCVTAQVSIGETRNGRGRLLAEGEF